MSGEWLAGIPNEVTFVMVDSSGNELTGLTISMEIRVTGQSFQAVAGTLLEIGYGWYSYTCTAAEAVVGPISIRANASGAVQQNLEYICEQRTPGVKFWTYRVTDLPGGAGNPIDGVYVWVTRTSVQNDLGIWEGYTDSNGYAKDLKGRDPLLPLGNNYFWKWKAGFVDDDNPDLEVVS